MQKKKKFLCSLIVLSLGLLSCGSPTDSTSSPTAGPSLSPSDQPSFKAAEGGTATCMKCHGDGTENNNNIQNARAGWATSMHALGITEENVGWEKVQMLSMLMLAFVSDAIQKRVLMILLTESLTLTVSLIRP